MVVQAALPRVNVNISVLRTALGRIKDPGGGPSRSDRRSGGDDHLSRHLEVDAALIGIGTRRVEDHRTPGASDILDGAVTDRRSAGGGHGVTAVDPDPLHRLADADIGGRRVEEVAVDLDLD